ncbi:hypothetical protein KFE98_05400 [bacterium SCSIO 12741]|nr:hypothetical protein KFE98_05400 [bacterium SCSIO 12741]
MRKILFHTLLFALPVVLLLVALPVERQQQYNSVVDDCSGRGAWLYDQVFDQSDSLEWVFIGASHVMCGIQDSLLASELNVPNLVNLGYCRTGRNFQYSVVKGLLEKHQVRHLVLGVLEKEPRFSHPIFPFVATSGELFTSPLWYNPDYLSDTWKHLAFKTELIQDRVYSNTAHPKITLGRYGYFALHQTISPEVAERERLFRAREEPEEFAWETAFYRNYSNQYLRKIAAECAKHGVKIYFLYLPAFGTRYALPRDHELYEPLGTILVPPTEILINTEYWADGHHFNRAGAHALSSWLVGELGSEDKAIKKGE